MMDRSTTLSQISAAAEWTRDIPNILGTYLVGSYSLEEEHSLSDVDLLAITKQRTSLKEVRHIQCSLRQQCIKFGCRLPIGIRVRAATEIPGFQRKLHSWGYDLNSAVLLAGIEIKRFTTSSVCVSNNTALLMDNQIERCWYDLLQFTADITEFEKRYILAKSIVSMVGFVAYARGQFCGCRTSRIHYLRKDCNLQKSLKLTPEAIDSIERICTDPQESSNSSQFLTIDPRIYQAIFSHTASAIEQNVAFLGVFPYWEYKPDLYKPIPKIASEFGITGGASKSDAYIWRSILFEFTFRAMALSQADQDIESQFTVLTSSIFSASTSKRIIGKPFSLAGKLRTIEELRLSSSEFGRDIPT